MLEQFIILTRGGGGEEGGGPRILWTYKKVERSALIKGYDDGPIINIILESCFVEGRSWPWPRPRAVASSFDCYVPGSPKVYTVTWTFHDEPRLVFVAVYDQKIFRHLLYVDKLLSRVEQEFLNIYNPADLWRSYSHDLREIFQPLKDEFESKQLLQLGGYKKNKGCCSSIFHSWPLEKSDLALDLRALKEKLMIKNLAKDVVEELCESVATKLEGKKLGWFTSVASTVQAAMQEALVSNIFSNPSSGDRLQNKFDARDASAGREEWRPFVIVYVGVKGVWESSDSIKEAYMLQERFKISVIMVANLADHGQVPSKCRREKNPIFEKWYKKDPAIAIKEAVQQARSATACDVVVHADGQKQAEAVVSMAYLCGADVIFIGGGMPTATWVNRMNVKSVVKKLLK